MEPIVTSEEMRAIDRHATKHLRIPSLLLMENAGRGVADVIERTYSPLKGKSIAVVCGKGSNGGDGFVAARHLALLGATVHILPVGGVSSLAGDTKINFNIVKQMEAQGSDGGVKLKIHRSPKPGMLPKFDLIVDALIGTGFSGSPRRNVEQWIQWMNFSHAPIVSVDLPSGVNADNGDAAKLAVRADKTVTMSMRKIGLTIGKGKNLAGRIKIIDLGIPHLQLKSHATFLVEGTDVLSALPARRFDAHKHSVGKILIIAGSRGLTGAAAMSSVSAMRTGAGSVVLCTPQSVYPILASKLTEVMVHPMPETSQGSLSLGAYEALTRHCDWADVVVIGPGLSRNDETQALVSKLVQNCQKPMLLDADALFAISGDLSVLKKRKTDHLILTPHLGEFAKLTGEPIDKIQLDRVERARTFARKHDVTLVLKSETTVTATSMGTVFVNPTGNPGMATAGSGDVLSGVIAGVWAQGMEPESAAWTGVYLHGLAGDLAAAKFGERSVMALDIQHYLPEALKNISHEVRR